MRLLVTVLMLCVAVPAVGQVQAPTAASVATSEDGAAALALFQADATLNYWALKHFDEDGDIALSEREAAVAADGLKAIADGDRDGRVTTYEFDRAREFIVARF